MSFTPPGLLRSLEHLEEVGATPTRYVVALSGGLDSMALLHALSELRKNQRVTVPLLAIHIDHGLQEQSAHWCQFCATSAAALGVDFQSVEVQVALDTGKGVEAAAREARYDALESLLQPGDWLLSAHHRDDQAETLLLNLIRGSGPAGIAGIADKRAFGAGSLVRPMLNVSRTDIEEYAAKAGIQWREDPSNKEQRFDRNFLRHEVLPVLQSRWPDIATRLQRSAGHASEAADLLAEVARTDLLRLDANAARLPIDGVLALPGARQRNVIRYALRQLDLPTPTTQQLESVMNELIPAREDAQPIVHWPGVSVRRYRNGLYLLPEALAGTLQSSAFEGEQIDLGAGLGTLRLEHGARVGLSESLVETGLRIVNRVGGEEFRPAGQQHTRKLKKLLQEEGVVPWMRDRLPLVYCGERLIAVADLWLAADATTEPGVALQWDRRPALH